MTDVRVSDRDRERVADRLAAHAAAGRLTVEELEERVARAHAALTERDLALLEHDLPGGRAVASLASRGVARRAPIAVVPRGALFAAVVAALAAAFAVPLLLVGHPIAPPFALAVIWWFVWRRRARRGWWAPSGW
jgi:Flp pilus assembly protein TadB